MIKAPFSGVLASVDAEKGETASPGMPLMRLIRLDPMYRLVIGNRDRPEDPWVVDATQDLAEMGRRLNLDPRTVKRIMAAIEPAITVIAGGSVAFAVFAAFMPLVKLLGALRGGG